MSEQFASFNKDTSNPCLDHDRPLRLTRPCKCGCDTREAGKGVGYISGADGKGAFFSIWIQDPKVYEAVRRVFRKHGLSAQK
jgi:hypothetical protein